MNSRQKVANRIMKLDDDRQLMLNALANISAVPPSALKSIINGDSKIPALSPSGFFAMAWGVSLYDFFDDEMFPL